MVNSRVKFDQGWVPMVEPEIRKIRAVPVFSGSTGKYADGSGGAIPWEPRKVLK